MITTTSTTIQQNINNNNNISAVIPKKKNDYSDLIIKIDDDDDDFKLNMKRDSKSIKLLRESTLIEAEELVTTEEIMDFVNKNER